MLNKNITKQIGILHGRMWILGFILLLLSSNLSAQYTVTIKVTTFPPSFNNEPVFIAGTFNNWNVDMQIVKRGEGVLTAELTGVDAGKHEFKFTRGSWKNVECDAAGRDIANRTFELRSDTTIFCAITGWKDDENRFGSLHTASKNVEWASESFYLPALSVFRKIGIYLPPGYYNNKKRYPVMYMQDGQNVFDNATAFAGEWGVDECLDSVIAQGKPGCIVVAIENGGIDRMSDYNPFEFTWKGEKDTVTFVPKADSYLDDIINELKPFIDKKYRTLSSKENTIIAGSSMGGLISYYAAVKHPEVFGKAGIFSPAFWTANRIDSLTDAKGGMLKGKYFFYMGGKEGESYLDDMNRIVGMLGKNSDAFIYNIIDPEAMHKEQYWRKWFAEFYSWIMADGYNVNISP